MTYYGATSYGRNASTECHWGNPLAFTTIDGIKVHAGGSSRGGGWWKMEPLPNLALGPDSEVKKGYGHLLVRTTSKNMDGWTCMGNLVERKPPAVLEMDFPDYGVPLDCDKEFWEALAVDIRERNIKVIHTMCMGGHGRTGIQLACLRWHLATEEEREAWPDAHTLIMSIREKYCSKAVEGDSQQDYVAEMCGIPIGDRLSFHKYGGGSYTGTTHSSYKRDTRSSLTAHNRKILSCDECDLVTVEDHESNIKEDEYCWDYTCRGMFADITEDVVIRSKAQTPGAAICLTTMDITSEINMMKLDILSEELMEKIHGKDWDKVLQKLMSNHKKTTLRGKLIRQIALYFSLPEQKKAESGDILVCVTDITCDPRMEGHYIPNYNKKGKDVKFSSRSFTDCGFCKERVSPNKMTYATMVSQGKALEKMYCICSECVVTLGPYELDDRLVESDEAKHAFVDLAAFDNPDAEADVRKVRIVDYLSPQHVYHLKTMRENHKGSTNDVKDTREALQDLGLNNNEVPEYEYLQAELWDNDDDDDSTAPLIGIGGNGR